MKKERKKTESNRKKQRKQKIEKQRGKPKPIYRQCTRQRHT